MLSINSVEDGLYFLYSPNVNVPIAVSKDMGCKKFCFKKILQFLTGDLYTGSSCKMVVYCHLFLKLKVKSIVLFIIPFALQHIIISCL